MGVFVGLLYRKMLGELRKAVAPLNAAAHSRANRFYTHFVCQVGGRHAANVADAHLTHNNQRKKHQHKAHSSKRNNALHI